MIQLKNVVKKYGDQTAVNHLDLHVKQGELCVLLGPSGCGKSTTIRLINKLIPVTEGEIYVEGQNINTYNVEQLRKDIGYVIQSIGLFPHMTVKENIAIVLKLQKYDKKDINQRVCEMLKLVGLDPEKYIRKYPHELSGGEAQRVGVARALASNPPILLMDEPFGAVDPLNRKRLQTEFLKIQKELKKTVVFVTHDIEEAIIMGDRIAIMNLGILEDYDTPQGLILRSKSTFVKEFLGQEYAVKILSKYKAKDMKRKEQCPAKYRLQENISLMSSLSYMIEHAVSEVNVTDSTGAISGSLKLEDIINILRKIEDI